MDEYEYAVEWYHPHGSDSWIATGWHRGTWTTLDKAKHERDIMLTGIWKNDDLQIVRRIKPGPVEVFDLEEVDH